MTQNSNASPLARRARRIALALGLLLAALALGMLFVAPRSFAQGATDTPAPADSAAASAPAPITVSTPAPAAPPAAPAPAFSPDLVEDALRRVIVPRAAGDVQREMDGARASASAAEGAVREARIRETAAKGRVQVKKRELEALRAKVAAAKKAKDEVTRGEQQRLSDAAELELKLLGRLADVETAEIARLNAVKSAGEATARAGELELKLAEARAAFEATGGASSADVAARALRLRKQVRELERQTLAAMKARADRTSDAAERDKDVFQKRIDALSAIEAIEKE